MKGKGIIVSIVACSFLLTACAATESPPPGRVGELRGKITRVERERGLIAVVEEPEGGQQWLQLRPFTSVRGAAASRVDALRSGQRVYVRYLREAERELPEVLSVTVLTYTLPPRGGGPGSFGLPSF